MADFELLAPGGHQELVDEVLDRLDTKADYDGYYQQLTAGAAEGITGGGPTDTAAWTYRACPGTDGPATIESIHGNTVVQDGSLLPVRMEGIETVGFNLLDLPSIRFGGNYNKEAGTTIISGSHALVSGENPCTLTIGTSWDGATYVTDVLSGQAYHFQSTFAADTSDSARVSEYMLDSDFKVVRHLGNYSQNYTINHDITVQDGERYHAISYSLPAAGTMTLTDTILNLSDPSRNGTYEPYWSSQRTIPAATYFPQGMRSAGSVRDELRADAAVTRVGERAYQSGDESDASVITDGTVTHYALATPTTTPIDPPLPLSYRTGKGGTERVTHTDPTAAPTLVVTYGSTADGIRDRALACIAPIEGSTASANYGVGSYLIHGGQLCKVTTAIASGEAITIGINVVATTVMAELLTLTQ